MASFSDIIARKDDHLNICTSHNVNSNTKSFWDEIKLPPHVALPEIGLSEVNLSTKFLGQSLNAPFLISSMTGGSESGDTINKILAAAAEKTNIALGVGSQRVALENKDSEFFKIRKQAPNAIIYANLGAVQLNYGVKTDDCLWLVEQLQAQAMILHLNPLQEAIQSEGDRNFKNLLPKIAELKTRLPVPLIIKEVGSGIDLKSAKRLLEVGVDAIDVAGLGGTHWGYIEGLRNDERRTLGEEFRNWGTPTPQLLKAYRQNLPVQTKVIASGGIRNSLDIAKAIYLGADMIGIALPFLKAAKQGEAKVIELIESHKEALRICLFCLGLKTPEELKTYEKI